MKDTANSLELLPTLSLKMTRAKGQNSADPIEFRTYTSLVEIHRKLVPTAITESTAFFAPNSDFTTQYIAKSPTTERNSGKNLATWRRGTFAIRLITEAKISRAGQGLTPCKGE